MAMSTRERYLATAVGVIAGLFGLQYAISSARAKLDSMQSNIDRMSTQIDDKNNTILEGDLAQRKLVRLQNKSLASNPGLAKQQ